LRPAATGFVIARAPYFVMIAEELFPFPVRHRFYLKRCDMKIRKISNLLILCLALLALPACGAGGGAGV